MNTTLIYFGGLLTCMIICSCIAWIWIIISRCINPATSFTGNSSTAQKNIKKTKTRDLHVKSTAQDDKIIMTGCPEEMEDLFGKDS